MPDVLFRGVPDDDLRALTVLHDERDFELIVAVTGQPTQRLV